MKTWTCSSRYEVERASEPVHHHILAAVPLNATVRDHEQPLQHATRLLRDPNLLVEPEEAVAINKLRSIAASELLLLGSDCRGAWPLEIWVL